jgi:hypothetical protein
MQHLKLRIFKISNFTGEYLNGNNSKYLGVHIHKKNGPRRLPTSENCLIHMAKYSFFIAATLRFLYP